MNHDNLPDDCPTREGEECPVVEEHKRNHRHSTDRMPASAMRIILALIGVIGAGSGGYLVRDRVAPAAQPVVAQAELVDVRARQDVAVLRAEMLGKLDAIKATQDQVSEQLRELRRELRRER